MGRYTGHQLIVEHIFLYVPRVLVRSQVRSAALCEQGGHDQENNFRMAEDGTASVWYKAMQVKR
ncbi:hypothetical protein JCM12294_45090 [Desulfocicer niacini]